MNHINEGEDLRDMVGNTRKNGNVGTNWIQFANLLIAITVVQWLSTLSHYLGDKEYLGWLLTFFFAIIYLVLISSFQNMYHPTILYRTKFLKTQLRYNLCAIFGLIIFGLFIPISCYSAKVVNALVPDVIIAICVWCLFAFMTIPTLNYYINKKEGIL